MLKTRYVEHLNTEGEVKFYTAEYKVLFWWVGYITWNGTADVFLKFYTLEEVKSFIDVCQINYDVANKAKIKSKNKVTYP